MKHVIALICLAAPAQRTRGRYSALPTGCDAYLTVQSASCEVEHHFTCQGDPDGHTAPRQS